VIKVPEVVKMIIDFYLLFLLSYFLLSFFLSSKRIFKLLLIALFVYLITWGAGKLDLKISYQVLKEVRFWLPLVIIIILTPDIRRNFENVWLSDLKTEGANINTEETKQEIIDAALYLSSQRNGALITIEKYNSLDAFAERAIIMDALVSKELLINIFVPNTPLHDGAVIIRGNHIRCAGAYYFLSETDKQERTMGSRHRAALGVSEISDSLSIVVSEETGNISIVIEGIMIRANDREKLLEYLNMYLK
jgi:diadenylate cyclase